MPLRSDPPIGSWTAWRTLTKRAGLPGLRFHDTRHQVGPQISSHGSFGDNGAEFHELPVNPWGAPARVLLRHAPNQNTDLIGDLRPAAARAGSPTPVETETGAVPPDDRLGLHDDEDVRPTGPKAAEGRPEESVQGIQFRVPTFAVEHRDLLPQSENLQCKLASTAKEDPDSGQDREDEFGHDLTSDIRHRGGQAFYAQGGDYIQMPSIEAFRDAESYYATLAHEAAHWTKHPTRLDRDFVNRREAGGEPARKQWGDEFYAREELVAELASAFLCADLEITPEIRDDHAAYIDHWLEVLKSDKRAIFSAAAHAQRAADYLHGLQPQQATAAA